MTFQVVDHLSLPGAADKPNEDAFAHQDRAALVMDGATPLGPSLLPGPSDAAWIAQFGARRIMAHLRDGDMPLDALGHALADTQKSFEGLSRHPIREKWQTPCASMMLVVETAEGTEFLWFGDCAALIGMEGGVTMVGETLVSRAREAARARLAGQAGVSPTERAQVLPLLRAGRKRINSGDNWLFSPEPRAAAHVSRAGHTLVAGTRLLLASDGFLALVSDYGAYDAAGLMAAASAKGLGALGEELRAIEQADARAEKFARFKTSDDATALLLDVV